MPGPLSNPSHVAQLISNSDDPLSAAASHIALGYAKCPVCNSRSSESLEVDRVKMEDRDAIVHMKCRCSDRFEVFIEEKVWGIVGSEESDLMPGGADAYTIPSSSMVSSRVKQILGGDLEDDDDVVLFINPSSINVRD